MHLAKLARTFVVCIGRIFFVDTNNHRIEFFDDEGRFLWQFGRSGKQSGQLCHPRKVAFFAETSKLVVCDRGSERSRLQIFTLADRRAKFERAIILDYVAIVAGLTTFRNLVGREVCKNGVNVFCTVRVKFPKVFREILHVACP